MQRPESSASAGSPEAALAWRALASAFSRNVWCGSAVSAMPFRGLGDAQIRLRQDLDRERREQRLDLPHLARIVGGEDELLHNPSARR